MIIANLTTTLANLVLARSVNYDPKVHSKLKHTFTIVNYNPKLFIVQAPGRKPFVRQTFIQQWSTDIWLENIRSTDIWSTGICSTDICSDHVTE
jgi:predicted nicotinamide N-methyase